MGREKWECAVYYRCDRKKHDAFKKKVADDGLKMNPVASALIDAYIGGEIKLKTERLKVMRMVEVDAAQVVGVE